MRSDLALVQTVDLLTPVVPDPYVFGEIAAANSLSDVYAMGGEPLTALNVMGYPLAGRRDWLIEILRGAQDKVTEAGACVVGGHTFNDPEIKFGLAVTGVIDPGRIITNDRARPGDELILTKPLGTGTLSQALMTTDNIPAELLSQGIAVMKQLNRRAAQAMAKAQVRCATDITGFGLIGHLQEMAAASQVAVRVFATRIPLLPGVLDLIEQGILNPGIAMNEASFSPRVQVSAGDGLSSAQRALLNLLYESENSGGLLIAGDRSQVAGAQSLLKPDGIDAPVIGEVISGPAGKVIIEF